MALLRDPKRLTVVLWTSLEEETSRNEASLSSSDLGPLTISCRIPMRTHRAISIKQRRRDAIFDLLTSAASASRDAPPREATFQRRRSVRAATTTTLESFDDEDEIKTFSSLNRSKKSLINLIKGRRGCAAQPQCSGDARSSRALTFL